MPSKPLPDKHKGECVEEKLIRNIAVCVNIIWCAIKNLSKRYIYEKSALNVTKEMDRQIRAHENMLAGQDYCKG